MPSSTPPPPAPSGHTGQADDAAPADAARTGTRQRTDAGATDRPRPRTRAAGNWRSLVLSMAAVSAVVFVLYSIVPQHAPVEQPPVDVAPVARQVREDAGVTVWLPQLGTPGQPWKATSVRETRTADGRVGWYGGYTRTDDDSVFVAVQQTQPLADPAAQKAWTDEAVSNGSPEGTLTIDGRTWTKYSNGGDPTRRALVGDVGGLTTAVSGLADDATLRQVVQSLRPYQG